MRNLVLVLILCLGSQAQAGGSARKAFSAALAKAHASGLLEQDAFSRRSFLLSRGKGRKGPTQVLTLEGEEDKGELVFRQVLETRARHWAYEETQLRYSLKGALLRIRRVYREGTYPGWRRTLDIREELKIVGARSTLKVERAHLVKAGGPLPKPAPLRQGVWGPDRIPGSMLVFVAPSLRSLLPKAWAPKARPLLFGPLGGKAPAKSSRVVAFGEGLGKGERGAEVLGWRSWFDAKGRLFRFEGGTPKRTFKSLKSEEELTLVNEHSAKVALLEVHASVGVLRARKGVLPASKDVKLPEDVFGYDLVLRVNPGRTRWVALAIPRKAGQGYFLIKGPSKGKGRLLRSAKAVELKADCLVPPGCTELDF